MPLFLSVFFGDFLIILYNNEGMYFLVESDMSIIVGF